MSVLLNVKNLVVNLKVPSGEVKAIRNISFNVNKGETLAIVGESGCGKSILCKSIIVFYRRMDILKKEIYYLTKRIFQNFLKDNLKK